MSGVATGLYMSWSGGQYTPPTGSAVPITQITGVGLSRNGQKEMWCADAGAFVSLITQRARTRRLSIKTGDSKIAMSIPENTPLTVVVTLLDAKNGTGAGAITITLINAVVDNPDASGDVNKFAQGTLSFDAYSTDGITDPLSFTVAT